MKDKQKKQPFFGIPLVLPYIKTRYKSIILMALCALVGSSTDVLAPLFQKYALDHYVEKSLSGLWIFAALYVLMILLTSVMNYFAFSHGMIIEADINHDLRNEVFTHLQTLSFSFFNQNSVGYLQARIMSDTSKIGALFSWNILDASWMITYLVFSMVIMLVLNAKLALMVIILVPLIAVFFSLFEKKLFQLDRESRHLNSQITSDFSEGITGAKTIKSLVIEDSMREHFEHDTSELHKKVVGSSKLRGAFSAVMYLASSIAISLVLWRAGYISENEIGTLSAFISYAQGMMEPVRWLVSTISSLVTTQVNIERFDSIMKVQSDVVDSPEVLEAYGDLFHPKKEHFETLVGDLEFRDVTFQYPDGNEKVLEHFSLHVPVGTCLAIVGETGAGKSTLANLICRFYEPTEGQVLVDGRDLRDRSQSWIHSYIGYVLQTPHLFSGSIRENVIYGKPDATEEEIQRALHLASCEDIIARLENGLDTDVGEGGDLLSVGEKQLLSFARAIICDPRILILDEATASVDTLTEQKIQAVLPTIIEGRTSVIIAHRLSTIKNADCILVVRDGKIIEQGTHKELLREKGYYYDLYTRQFEEDAAASAFDQLQENN